MWARGALAAMVVALLGGEWLETIVAFVVFTGLLYATTYRWRKRLVSALHKDSEQTATGMDALIGRTGTVVAAPDCLRMKIDGDVWQVKAAKPGEPLQAGDEVRVEGYESIILLVSPVAP